MEILKTLLSAGATKDKADTDGSTALRMASINGQVECVKELLAVKVDLNKADEWLDPLDMRFTLAVWRS